MVDVTKKKRNPLAMAWENGLPVFVCGGGSRLEPYQKAIVEHYENWRKGKTNIAPCRLVELPKPTNLEADDLSQSEFHRLAVAYGLSFPFDKKTFIPPSRIKDINPSKTEPNVTSSQECPGCGSKTGCYCK